MKEFVGLRAKTYSYLKDNNNENKKKNNRKMFVIKRTFKCQDYKNWSEEAQIENKINHAEANQIDVDNLKENHKEFIKNNPLILKSQERFRSEKWKA